MDQQSEHAVSTGEIEEAPEPQDHPAHCLCTSCTTEQLLERGGGRFDSNIETYLHHIRDLRELRTPRSTGGAGYTASGAAAVADSEQRESDPMTPTELYEELASIAMQVIKPPYFRQAPVTYEELDEIAERLYEFIGKQKARTAQEAGNGNDANHTEAGSPRATQ